MKEATEVLLIWLRAMLAVAIVAGGIASAMALPWLLACLLEL